MRGSEIAAEHGLILVDTKYEFGKKDGKVFTLLMRLILQIHRGIFMQMNIRRDLTRDFLRNNYQKSL